MYLFEALGSGTYDSAELTRGPWRADAQHGGPPSALLGRVVEQQLPAGQRVARINVELVRPVPLSMLETEVDVDTVSRRVSRVRVRLISNGELVARATAVSLQESDMAQPDGAQEDNSALLPPETATTVAPVWVTGASEVTFHRDALEHRFVSGGFGSLGPSDGWHRLSVDLVQSEPTSPLCRVLAVADLASGVSSIYSEESGLGLINADLDVAVIRPLVGDWVHIQAATETDGSGTGLCVATLGDQRGTVASGTQCLLGVGL